MKKNLVFLLSIGILFFLSFKSPSTGDKNSLLEIAISDWFKLNHEFWTESQKQNGHILVLLNKEIRNLRLPQHIENYNLIYKEETKICEMVMNSGIERDVFVITAFKRKSQNIALFKFGYWKLESSRFGAGNICRTSIGPIECGGFGSRKTVKKIRRFLKYDVQYVWNELKGWEKIERKVE